MAISDIRSFDFNGLRQKTISVVKKILIFGLTYGRFFVNVLLMSIRQVDFKNRRNRRECYAYKLIDSICAEHGRGKGLY